MSGDFSWINLARGAEIDQDAASAAGPVPIRARMARFRIDLASRQTSAVVSARPGLVFARPVPSDPIMSSHGLGRPAVSARVG
jgi:hypothetical protein